MEDGGWGLIHPRSQVLALKAKWIARWKTERPGVKWQHTFETVAQYTRPLIQQDTPITHFAALPPTKMQQNPTPQAIKSRKADTLTHHILMSWTKVKALLKDGTTTDSDPREAILFGKHKSPLKEFSVRKARSTIVSGLELPQPITIADKLANPGQASFPWDWTAAQWKLIWDRVHNTNLRRKEHDLLYKLAYNRVTTNNIRKHYKEADTDGTCRRCDTGASEDNRHAFHDCPELATHWDSLHDLIKTIYPDLNDLSRTAQDRIFCWPERDNMNDYPLVYHLQTAALWSIYVTFSKLGAGEQLEPGALQSIFLQNCRTRGMEEWIRAEQQDKKNATRPIREEEAPMDPHAGKNAFYEMWHHTPHIKVTKKGPQFGDAFQPP
ncbi:hypothetical protein KI688_007386 [Linnemannia hyalina]|uniref:Uncharacterized protein n=1 Tax=Linnemannia hyalina TaxID=64524 RepID=A0A9P7XHG4_9FUNG|nr:hypothetical protein KI688_007386 [Linnemannia hyalina]